MRTLLAFLIFASALSTQSVLAQEQSEVTFKGWVTLNKKNCPGVELTLCQTSKTSADCNQINQLTTTKNGRFEFKLNRDNSFRIKVRKEGFVDRIIEVNTALPAEAIESSKLTFTADIELSLYKDSSEPVTVASVYFDAEKGAFDYRLPKQ